MPTTGPAQSETFFKLAKFINKGNAHVVSAEFMDWLESISDSLPGTLKDLHSRIRTLPNPNRVGILDQYIIFTKWEGMHFIVKGILKMNGEPIDARVSCDRGKDGFLSLWFVGFNNSCQWKGDLIETDLAGMIADKIISLAPSITYANGKEVWE